MTFQCQMISSSNSGRAGTDNGNFLVCFIFYFHFGSFGIFFVIPISKKAFGFSYIHSTFQTSTCTGILTRSVTSTTQTSGERYIFEVKFHGFFVLTVTRQGNISVRFYTTRAFVDTRSRMVHAVDGGNTWVGKIERDICHFSTGQIGIVIITAYFGANRFAFGTTGTIFSNNIACFFGNLYIEIITVFVDTINLAIQCKRNVRMTSRFRHFRCRNTGCTIERWEHFTKLNHFTTNG